MSAEADRRLRPGQVAADAGVGRQTLRYYERRGLIGEADRTVGGHRLYPPETVTRLRMIKAAQRLGFTLDQIADLIETGRHRRRGDGGLQASARTRLAQVEDRIAELEAVADLLRRALAAGCEDLEVCAATAECPLPFPDSEPGPDSAVGPIE